MNSKALDNIKHVVVVMFENRSFDHIFGAMPGVNGVLKPDGTPKDEIFNTLNPNEPPSDSNPPQGPVNITPDNEATYIPNDFNHDYWDGMLPDLFGPNTTGIIQGAPQNNAQTWPATSAGFLSTNQTNFTGAMTYFEWGSMKVLHPLAEEFVVCDNWFCDMPGHTLPNRAFLHCGTTGDARIDDSDQTILVNQRSIFEQIQDNGLTWKVYWPGNNCDTDFLNETVIGQKWKAEAPDQANRTRVPANRFCLDVQNGNLPFYSFIMCWNYTSNDNNYNTNDTSMHPHSSVRPGENFLASIYNTLRNSNQYWENTLLIVTFDENGGIFDHVRPPATVAPYAQNPPPKYVSSFDDSIEFDFTLLGLRVPAILISPWLRKGIDSTQYQNTSVPKFLQGFFLTKAGACSPCYLSQRDHYAPSLKSAFDQFGLDACRTDCIGSLAGYADITGMDICTLDPPSEEQLAAPPVAYMEKLFKQYISGLPGHADSGKPITRSFATVGEMMAYSNERSDAAVAYCGKKK